MQQIALCTLPFVGKLYNEVQDSITYVTMVELKTYKIGDIDISAVVCQKQGFLLSLHDWSIRLLSRHCHSVRKRKLGFQTAETGQLVTRG